MASDRHQAPGEEELAAALEEQFRKLKVVDLLAQTVVTVSQLAFMRMAAEGRDLAQARLAIDALRAGQVRGVTPLPAVAWASL